MDPVGGPIGAGHTRAGRAGDEGEQSWRIAPAEPGALGDRIVSRGGEPVEDAMAAGEDAAQLQAEPPRNPGREVGAGEQERTREPRFRCDDPRQRGARPARRDGGADRLGGHARVLQRPQRQVQATASPVDRQVLQEVHQLQPGADRVGGRPGRLVPSAEEPQHELPHGIGRAPAVVEQRGAVRIAGHAQVLLEGVEQGDERLPRQAMGPRGGEHVADNRLDTPVRKDVLAQPTKLPQALVDAGVALVGDVVGMAGEAVDRHDRRTQRRRHEAGGNREILVMVDPVDDVAVAGQRHGSHCRRAGGPLLTAAPAFNILLTIRSVSCGPAVVAVPPKGSPPHDLRHSFPGLPMLTGSSLPRGTGGHPPATLAKRLAAGLGGLLLFATLLAGCNGQAAPPPPEAVRPVRTLVVEERAISHALSLPAEVRPRIEVRYGFRVGGKIAERKVSVGDQVRAGQSLATLDPEDVRPAIDAARAALEAARTELELAESELGRIRELRAQGYVSQGQLDRQQAAADAARARVAQAGAQLANARNTSRFQDLRADAPGVVTAVDAEAGQVVAAGQVVIRVAPLDEFELAVDVPEAHRGAVAVIERWRATLPALAGRTFEA